MNNEFENKTFGLKFMLGEFLLISVPFKMLTKQQYFLESDHNIDNEFIVSFLTDKKIDGVLLRSHPIEKRLYSLVFESNYLRYITSQYLHCYINLKIQYAEYINSFSSKTRSTLRRKIRKLSEISGGNIIWKKYCKREEMQEFHRLAMVVSQKSYQEKMFKKGLPNNDEFIKDMIELAGDDRIRAYILFVNKMPVSYLFLPVLNGGVVSYDYVGYDKEYSKYSPGTILMHLVIEDIFKEKRFTVFDFTEGEAAHKELFSNEKLLCADICYFKKKFSIMLIVLFHYVISIISKTCVKILNLLGLKKTIKNLIRRKI